MQRVPRRSLGTSATNTRNCQNMTKGPGSTITRPVINSRGQVERVYQGTNDTGATDADPSGGATGNNMVLVSQSEYNNGNDGGCNREGRRQKDEIRTKPEGRSQKDEGRILGGRG